MSIIRETKWALLELFPEQKATEADAEVAAWKKAIADAKAKVAAEAEAKAKAKAKAAEKAGEKTETVEAAAEEPPPADAGPAEETAVAEEPDPDMDPDGDPPVSVEPEGPRPKGVMVRDYRARGVHIDVNCSPDQVTEAATILVDAGFFLEAVTGVDWIKDEEMEVVYDYNRTDGLFCRVVVRTRVPRSAPEVPTVSEICPGANWHERETHDFFGIKFKGHPYLVPILLPEDADFHPLLKDFTP